MEDSNNTVDIAGLLDEAEWWHRSYIRSHNPGEYPELACCKRITEAKGRIGVLQEKIEELTQFSSGLEINVLALVHRSQDAEAEVERLRSAWLKRSQDVEQTLGKALGYPWFKDDHKNFPGATEVDGVCVGEHVVESIVDEAARQMEKLKAANAEMVGILYLVRNAYARASKTTPVIGLCDHCAYPVYRNTNGQLGHHSNKNSTPCEKPEVTAKYSDPGLWDKKLGAPFLAELAQLRERVGKLKDYFKEILEVPYDHSITSHSMLDVYAIARRALAACPKPEEPVTAPRK